MTKDVVIIEAGGANFASIEAAINRSGFKPIITDDPNIITCAERVILPGVGAAKHAMDMIYKKELYDVIRSLKQPVLGICLGQQILCEFSEEGDIECLRIIPIKVKKLRNTRVIPHMGWNNLNSIKQDEPLLEGIGTQDDFYFTHSFVPEIDSNYTIGICDYGVPFSAAIKKNNFYGVQFHPEKSGVIGARLLINFLMLK